MLIRKRFEVSSSVSDTKEFLVGIECEIEDLRETVVPSSYWTRTEDGSLRNNGMEFVSFPIDKAMAKQQFNLLHNCMKYHSDDVSVRFSERTSIHVHVNCLSLEEEQVRSIILWYALFEPFFFQMVEPSRKNNIHCVSLNQTHLSKHYHRSLSVMKQMWSKYTALNILPLSKYGTLEFRHMQGTDNQELFDMWLDTIDNLWMYGQTTTIDKELIMKPSFIRDSFVTIFKDAPAILKQVDSLHNYIDESLIDIKLSLIQGKV